MAVVAAALGPSEALAWCRTTTMPAQPDPLVCPAAGVPVAWPYGCAALHLDPRVPAGTVPLDDLRRLTLAAIERWATATCDAQRGTHPGFRLQLLGDLEVPVGYSEAGPNASTVSIPARWSNDAFHAPDAAALTVVTFANDTADILDTDVELNVHGPSNPRGMPFSLDAPALDRTDLQTTLAHELGHVQGLAHSAERDAVMWSVVRSEEQRRTPTADDARGLCTVYPPRDVSSCDPALHGLAFHGRGVSCSASPRPSGGALSWGVVLLALAAMGRRRGLAAGLVVLYGCGGAASGQRRCR